MEYANTSNPQKSWVLKITPVRRGEMYKRKQAPKNTGIKNHNHTARCDLWT